MISVIEINSNTKDFISITKYTPKITNNKSIIISSATGVLQNYYSKFATYLCDLGFSVYSFDYNGIGKSLNKSIKENTSDLTQWAKNQGAIIDYAQTLNPSYKLILITHSIGGPLIGLNNKTIALDAIITVASQTSYWRLYKGYYRFRMYMFWHVLIPGLTPLFGYFPSKTLGLFENLPKPVVNQWKNWGKHPNYFLKEYNKTDLFFGKIKCPTLVLSFSKDEFAPKETVDWFAQLFTSTTVDRRHILNKPHVGHFGFFRESFKTPLWELTENWINSHA